MGASLAAAMALSCRCIVDGSYGFVVPNSCTGVSLMVAMALSCQIAVQMYWTVAKAVSCQKCGDLSRQ